MMQTYQHSDQGKSRSPAKQSQMSKQDGAVMVRKNHQELIGKTLRASERLKMVDIIQLQRIMGQRLFHSDIIQTIPLVSNPIVTAINVNNFSQGIFGMESRNEHYIQRVGSYAKNEDQIWQISQINPDGFTRYIYGLSSPVNGYCVAYADTQNCFGRKGLIKALIHAQTHSQVIGGWLDGGNYYFDSVRVYQTENAAIEAAIRESQIGYFNLAGGYIPIMAGGQLLPRYQAMLNSWNQRRAQGGMAPFQRL